MKAFLTNMIEGLLLAPDRHTYWNFRHFGLTGDEFVCLGTNGKTISGLMLPGQPDQNGAILGTVLYCHPCDHNYQYYLPQISWLIPAGYNVVLFDYRGAGKSQGEMTLAGNVEDALSVMRYLRTRRDIDPERIVMFGQATGAEVALNAVNRDKRGVVALIVESLYSSHQNWLSNRFGPGVGYLCSAFLSKVLPEPQEVIRQVSLPLAIVVPDRDKTVSKKQAKELIEQAPKQREVWRAEGVGYLGVFVYPCVWRSRFLEFVQDALTRKVAFE